MIFKYTEYIKESEDKFTTNFCKEIKEFIISLLPEDNNIQIYAGGGVSLELYCGDEQHIISIEYNRNYDERLNRMNIFNNIKKYYIGFSNGLKLNYETIEELKEDIKHHFNTLVANYRLDLDIMNIPVLNQDVYSDYIYKAIMKYPEKSKYLNNIEQYLNSETRNKLQHLIDASNFDLI